MATLHFTKMEGTGNDFIVVDGLERETDSVIRQARLLCDRRFGIGADQLLLILPSRIADFRMGIVNADGSEVEMCGNGIRCFARYLIDHGRFSGKTMAVETPAGIIRPTLTGDDVTVDMGQPVLNGPDIPVTMKGQIISRPLTVDGTTWKMTCVSMGNPHCVIRVDGLDAFPVIQVGRKIETDPLFPNRTNVEFVEIMSEDEIAMRVWERGAGETLSCGTGACASAVAAALNGWTGRNVVVHLKGGDLKIDWLDDDRVRMTGPAREVFSGDIDLRD